MVQLLCGCCYIVGFAYLPIFNTPWSCIMDYKRAQRNLALINESTTIDEDLEADMEHERHEDDEEMISTQVPSVKFSQSSVSSMEDDAKIHSSNVSSPTKVSPMKTGKGTSTTKVQPRSLIETVHEEEEIHIVADTAQVSPSKPGLDTGANEVFINTQIQGRLDDFEHDKEMKGQLKQFRFTPTDSQLNDKDQELPDKVEKRPAVRRNKNPSDDNPAKRQKITKNSGNARAQSLLEKLSGKHKKVKDILSRKTKKMKNKPAVEKYDVYNADEWKAISSSILSNFPKSSTQDVKDVFSYLYGKDNTDDMWQSSQKPPLDLVSTEKAADDESSQHSASTQERPGAMRLLSLSQVMGDTSNAGEKSLEIVNEQATQHSNASGSSLYMTQENVIKNISEDDSPELQIVDVLEYKDGSVKSTKDSAVPTVISDSDEDHHSASFRIIERQYPGNETDISDLPEVVSPNKNDTSVPQLSDAISEDESRICDSMDETAIMFPEVRLEDIQSFNESIRPTLAPPSAIPTLRRQKTELDDDIIDLTQQSYKAVDSLISPIKPDAVEEEPTQTTENKDDDIQVSATRAPTLASASLNPPINTDNVDHIQVSATRAPTLASATLQAAPDNDIFTIHARLADCICEKIKSDQLPFALSEACISVSESQQVENDVVYDSECSDQPSRILNVQCYTPEAPRVITSPSKDAGSVISSQSAQELRGHIRDIGLKPARSKTQMVESLEAASQVLTQEGTEPTIATRRDVYNHLTLLLKQSPALLEKARTFQPILLDDFLQELVELDPFVDRIDESTVQEWADDNGVSLKRS